MKRIAIVSILAGCLSGCGWGQLKKDHELDAPDKFVFVMGVEPQGIELVLHYGTTKMDYFVLGPEMISIVHEDQPHDGYIVGDAPVGKDIGFAAITLRAWEGEKTFLRQPVCAEQKSPVFSVPGAKVVYVGDLVFSYEDGFLDYEMTSDFEKARQFVDENYPNLAGRLEVVDVKLLYTTTPCEVDAGPVYIYY